MNIRKLYLASIKYSDRGKMDNQIATLLDENATLRKENETLKKENEEIMARLKRYTTNPSFKNYYNQNKEVVQQSQKKYIDKLKEEDPERLKEYRRKANQRYREKKKKLQNEIEK